MKHLILASGSPRRRELMSQVGLDFTVVTSDADENIKEMEPEDYVRELSSIKAQSVLEQYADKDSVIVIGADTIVYHKGEILTKPRDEEDAFRILKSLEGQIHQVYTGVTICSTHKNVSFYEKTDVWVYDMTDEEIRDYIRLVHMVFRENSQHTLRVLKATIITLSVCLLQDLYMRLKHFKEKIYG